MAKKENKKKNKKTKIVVSKKPKGVLVKKKLKRKKVIQKNFKKLKKTNNFKKTLKTKNKIQIKKEKVRKRKKTIKTNKQISREKTSPESLFKAKIRVVGIGGGGGSIVSEIGKSLERASFVVADTDVRSLKKKPGIKYFWFGEKLTHGLGTGVNIDLAKQAAEQSKEKISEIFKDQDIVIFIASLGGGLGSGATQIFADEAKKFGGITFGIFTLPFRFEGKNKSRIAQTALKNLRNSLNVSLTIPNEKIFKIIGADTPITDAFSMVNKNLIGSLESLINLIYTPGVINIDFADLRTILKGRGNFAFLNTVEESGKDRADKICKTIISNPLIQANNFPAEKILFNIAGSENLSMLEVEKISRHIGEQNPRAKIIFGISKNLKLKNKIKTTILMTGGGSNVDIPIKEEIEEQIKTKAKTKRFIKKTEESIEKNIQKETLKPKKETQKKLIKKPLFKKPRKVKEPTSDSDKQKKQPVLPKPELKPMPPIAPVLEQKKMNVIETISLPAKKSIRRSGLEIKKAEELEEKKRIDQEKEWEIPAFLRRVKFNK
jgi:cell division protein FtsZ